LRQGAAWPARTRQPRSCAGAISERPGRRGAVVTSAIDLAERAVAAAEGDGAEAVVQTEHSGFARFAGSEVHQPTLIENVSVFLRVIRGNRVGTAAANLVDDEGLRELALRAVDPAAVAREAAELAGRTANADELAPGTYRAVLGPYAVGELLQYFAFDTFSGLALLEERSFLGGKLGERHFDEKVSITDDALDPRGLPKGFDFEGVPKQRVPLVENGVLRGAVCDSAS